MMHKQPHISAPDGLAVSPFIVIPLIVSDQAELAAQFAIITVLLPNPLGLREPGAAVA